MLKSQLISLLGLNVGISNIYEEMLVCGLLLVGVYGVYLLLKLHYHFAFMMVKNTASYEKHHSIIEKAKTYVFAALKGMLWLVWIGVFLWCSLTLYEGVSIKALFIGLWAKIPQGFFLHVVLVLVRIAVIIAVSRYLLKRVYAWLDKRRDVAIQHKCAVCKEESIMRYYAQLHSALKYTVALGIVYRITLYFPLGAMVHETLWMLFVFYVAGVLGVVVWRAGVMMQERYRTSI